MDKSLISTQRGLDLAGNHLLFLCFLSYFLTAMWLSKWKELQKKKYKGGP